MMIGVAPHVAHQVGGHVGGERRPGRAGRQRQQRVHDVVLGHAACAPCAASVRSSPLMSAVNPLPSRSDAPRSRSYIAMPHSKMQALTKFHQRLDEVPRLPPLRLVDAHDPVAEVVVLAQHVGVDVVPVVVGPLPLLRRGGVVPLPGRGVDLRVAHPVPLTVQDVVTDLHVVEDLGQRQGCRPDPPRRTVATAEQRDPSGRHQRALDPDDAPDVRRVAGATACQHLVADGVQPPADLGDLVRAEVGVRALPDRVRSAGGNEEVDHPNRCPKTGHFMRDAVHHRDVGTEEDAAPRTGTTTRRGPDTRVQHEEDR